MQMTLKIWIMLLLLSFIWGGSFLFGRIAVLEIAPLNVVMLRVVLSAITLLIFVIITKRKFALTKWLITNALIMGALNNVIPFTFILYGQKEIGSGLAAVVNGMTPIWTLLIANWLTKDEKLSPQKIIGVGFGFFGVALLMGGDIWHGLTASALAQLSVLIATISYGFAGVFGKRFKEIDPIIVATSQLTASALIMLPIALMFEDQSDILNASPAALWSVIGFAIICTAFAYVLFFKILSAAGAVNVSLVTFLVPVSAVILGMLFLNETLSYYHLTGMTLIGIGLTFIDGRLIDRFTKSI